jgi:hypothetical protein
MSTQKKKSNTRRRSPRRLRHEMLEVSPPAPNLADLRDLAKDAKNGGQKRSLFFPSFEIRKSVFELSETIELSDLTTSFRAITRPRNTHTQSETPPPPSPPAPLRHPHSPPPPHQQLALTPTPPPQSVTPFHTATSFPSQPSSPVPVLPQPQPHLIQV